MAASNGRLDWNALPDLVIELNNLTLQMDRQDEYDHSMIRKLLPYLDYMVEQKAKSKDYHKVQNAKKAEVDRLLKEQISPEDLARIEREVREKLGL